MNRKTPRVVIIGAGFGGLEAVKALSDKPVDITVVDRNNFHTFLPLVYQVGAAELEPDEIAYPVRSLLRDIPNAEFLMTEVTSVDMEHKYVQCFNCRIDYDYLIIATGSEKQYFGIPGAAENTMPLSTLEDGILIRNHILSCFEKAVYETSREIREKLLTFVIVGAGPTGVEFAGALAELIYKPLRKDYSQLDISEVKITLIEATPKVTPAMPEDLGEYTRRRLEKLGVTVLTDTLVSEIKSGSVYFDDGDHVKSDTVIWTAGVKGSGLELIPEPEKNKGGRVILDPTLQVPDYPEVYIVGDLAYIEQDGNALPMMAPVATQQGKLAAKNILKQIENRSPEDFHYRDKGEMLTIGRNKAVARIGRMTFTGFFAWVVWAIVHIYQLIGFRNRLQVLINWAYDYIFFERVVRLILPGSFSKHTTKSDSENVKNDAKVHQ
ncbi:MAG: FAD-dependent oxidoreductase [candidate division Zixibacteria bacterium]|nr:FAD-dependent oxidoreductase [candidate division Zixibacteria bacterium]